MAGTRFRLSSWLVILFLGFHGSSSLECTQKNINQCRDDNYAGNGCSKPRALIACLQALNPCTDDELRLEMVSSIMYHNKTIQSCPGLEDGNCFRTATMDCTKDVPYDALEGKLSTKDEIAACKAFKETVYPTIDCMNSIKPKCKSKGYLSSLDSLTGGVRLVQAHCISVLKNQK